MASTYRTMTVEHLGPDATDADLSEFREICEAAHGLHPEMDDAAVTDAVFGDGDYIRNARRLGVDVDSIIDSEAPKTVVATLNTQIRYEQGYITPVETLPEPVEVDNAEVVESGCRGWGESNAVVRHEGGYYLATVGE